MSKLIRNLNYLLNKHGLNPTELQNRTGVPQPTIHRILAGNSEDPRTRTLKPIANHFGVTVEHLRTGDIERDDIEGKRPETSSCVIALHPDDIQPPDTVQVPEYRVSFSAGNGHRAAYDVIEESEPATYRLSWFHKEGIKPKNARRFRVVGDSMEPVLCPGDSVLVDTADNDPTRILDGKIYAIRYGNELRIKRLFRRLDGTLILRSDNKAHTDEEVPPELAEEHITILGRVREKSGTGGL